MEGIAYLEGDRDRVSIDKLESLGDLMVKRACARVSIAVVCLVLPG